MAVARLNGVPFCGLAHEKCQGGASKKVGTRFPTQINTKARSNCCVSVTGRITSWFDNSVKCCASTSGRSASNYGLNRYNVEEEEESPVSSDETMLRDGMIKSMAMPRMTPSDPQRLQNELIMLSLPAIAAQAIEPLAQLMETAYIGRLGPLELASAGVSVSIFNIISKVLNIPLLSVATSFVAEDISRTAGKKFDHETEDTLPSVSTALLLAVMIGTLEALALYFGSGILLTMMGISSVSPMRIQAQQFLSLRAFGAPAVVISMAIQGIFRGFKDTKTPVLCLGVGNLLAVFLFPTLMYYCRLGITGAAISTVVSQYAVTFLMIWCLNKRTPLTFPRVKDLQFGSYLSSGGFLLGRTFAAVLTITMSTSMAARLGPLPMAAHQICLQLWLSVSLLADAQASSSQALLASSYAQRDYNTVKDVTYLALKGGLLTGISLAIILGASFGYLATLFTKDSAVLGIARSGILFVSASQPLSALAYIFDGLYYGLSDFSYAAYSMMFAGAVSCSLLLCAPSIGLPGVWFALTLFMALRTAAGYLRLSSKNGPWYFLQGDIQRVQFT